MATTIEQLMRSLQPQLQDEIEAHVLRPPAGATIRSPSKTPVGLCIDSMRRMLVGHFYYGNNEFVFGTKEEMEEWIASVDVKWRERVRGRCRVGA